MPGKPRTSIDREKKKRKLNWKRKQQTVQGQSRQSKCKKSEWAVTQQKRTKTTEKRKARIINNGGK
jgi:hypothetical protein